jgi:probable HAF family extracellular repeat protein
MMVSAGGTTTDFGNGGQTSGEAKFINNNGQVAGNLGNYAFYLPAGTSLTSTLVNGVSLNGATNSVVDGINGVGQVIGESSYTDSHGFYQSTQHAFIYTPGTTPVITDIGTFVQDEVGASKPFAINGSYVVGQADIPVVGDPSTDSGFHHAFLYDATSSALTDLTPLTPFSNSAAVAVNSLGDAVGCLSNSSVDCAKFYSTTTSLSLALDAFVYLHTGQMYDLNDPSLGIMNGTDFYHLITAVGINDSGLIVGTGLTTTSTKPQAYALSLYPIIQVSTVPEPSSLFPIAALAALACIRRRRAAN